jgi:hypothetical protein
MDSLQIQPIVEQALFYVKAYEEKYPQDRLMITGGTAAYLHLLDCGIDSEVKDIDVEIETTLNELEIIERWLSRITL